MKYPQKKFEFFSFLKIITFAETLEYVLPTQGCGYHSLLALLSSFVKNFEIQWLGIYVYLEFSQEFLNSRFLLTAKFQRTKNVAMW